MHAFLHFKYTYILTLYKHSNRVWLFPLQIKKKRMSITSISSHCSDLYLPSKSQSWFLNTMKCQSDTKCQSLQTQTLLLTPRNLLNTMVPILCWLFIHSASEVRNFWVLLDQSLFFPKPAGHQDFHSSILQAVLESAHFIPLPLLSLYPNPSLFLIWIVE